MNPVSSERKKQYILLFVHLQMNKWKYKGKDKAENYTGAMVWMSAPFPPPSYSYAET